MRNDLDLFVNIVNAKSLTGVGTPALYPPTLTLAPSPPSTRARAGEDTSRGHRHRDDEAEYRGGVRHDGARVGEPFLVGHLDDLIPGARRSRESQDHD